MAKDPGSGPAEHDAEPRMENLYRLTDRLWVELPEGTMERARKSYLYFKSGGKGHTLRDLEERVREIGR